MKVAIDISPLKSIHKFRGVGNYTRHLVEALQRVDKKNEYLLITDCQSLTRLKPDLVHYPYFDLFWLTLPFKKPYPTLVTVHDLTPLVFPHKFPKGIRGWLKYQIQRQSLRGAKAIITDSRNSKRDIVKFIGFPEKKIYIIHLAADKKFRKLKTRNLMLIKKKYNLPEKFILYVGDVNWNKNVPGLIKAFSHFNPPAGGQASSLKLVLVGKAFENKDLPETKTILQLIESLGLINQTRILGYVPGEDLVALYNLATVYCQPSFYEGFGLPVLEAMACGTPVVAANTSSLPEICSEAAIMVNPYDINDIAEGIGKVIGDKIIRDRLVKKGLVQAKKFSWEKTAKETIKVYHGVLKRK